MVCTVQYSGVYSTVQWPDSSVYSVDTSSDDSSVNSSCDSSVDSSDDSSVYRSL